MIARRSPSRTMMLAVAMLVVQGCTAERPGPEGDMDAAVMESPADGGVEPSDAEVMDGGDASDGTGPWTGDVHGWTVHLSAALNPATSVLGADVLAQLDSDFAEIEDRLSSDQVAVLRMTPIWVEVDVPDYPSAAYFEADTDFEGEGLSPAWSEGVLLGNAANYLDYVVVQPAMVLHELSHAWDDRYYHFENQDVLAVYDSAKSEGIYDWVAYAGGGYDAAYAGLNASEYFAELSEAWFWENDYYPFTRSDLLAFDPAGAAAVSEAWER